MNCPHCNSPVSPDRWEAGVEYCMAKDCIAKELRLSQDNFRFVLVPKQGFAYVAKDDPFLTDGGKSSGR